MKIKVWSIVDDSEGGGHTVELYATEAAANDAAAESTRQSAENSIRRDMIGEITADNWREKLDELQDIGCMDFIYLNEHEVDAAPLANETMPKVHTLCWWLVGSEGVCIDFHSEGGGLVRFGPDEPICFDGGEAEARGALHALQTMFQIPDSRVVRDLDSEEAYRD